jgi:uridylate kinase
LIFQNTLLIAHKPYCFREAVMALKYSRIMLKISGEALAGEKGFGIDQEILNNISSKIKEAHDMGVDIGIVVGGGNFWRGKGSMVMDRTTADHMGMLATVINALALQDALEGRGVPTRVPGDAQGGRNLYPAKSHPPY